MSKDKDTEALVFIAAIKKSKTVQKQSIFSKPSTDE